MFSGKTTELMRRIRRQKRAARACALFRPKKDTRYDDTNKLLVSHDGSSEPCTQACESLTTDTAVPDGTKFVGIDEAHLFSGEESVREAVQLWSSRGMDVCVVSLSGDSNQTCFKVVADLIPLADEICHLTAICERCGDEATMTLKTGGSAACRKEVGGKHMYEPVCATCLTSASHTNVT